MTFIYILTATIFSSIFSLVGSFFLARKKSWPKKFLLQLTAFSSGVLLATSFLHLAPEAVEALPAQQVFSIIFFSIVLLFVLERLVLWHHHHEEDHCCGPQPTAWFITFGDSLHNFLDGVLITGTFLVDPKLGLLTAFAVAAHEIPQEIADFSIMVAGGMKRKQALLLNFVSALFSVFGALVAYFFVTSVDWAVPYVVSFSVGMFLYVALSDLIPELHAHDLGVKQKWSQLLLFFFGILLIAGITFIMPHEVIHLHDEQEAHTDEFETHDQEDLDIDIHEEEEDH